ncbi:DEDD exonuclease domain-containing protein [soil metagenome]
MTSSHRYEHLLERAVACIDKHGGKLDDARLVGHVFGVGGSEKLWAPLLHTILATDPRVSRLPNGWWTTVRLEPSGSFPSEYVVVDVETTGLKPRQHRVIDVALIRISAGADPLVWTSLVDPGRRVPDYIRKLTGIDDAMVGSAPEFRSLGATIQQIVGEHPIVGHNVEFDLGFLNAEFARCGLPRLVNTALDTLPLADELLPGARRLGLQDVMRELGLPSQRAHRALADAEMTLAVYQALLVKAVERGWETIEDLLQVTTGARRRRSAGRPVGRGRSLLDASHLTAIPHAPGVYIMRDANDRVIYVGKAKDLRKRVGSYYSQPLGYTRKMDGLLESLAGFETTVVGTELEALMLESQLIRRYRPRFNTVQRNAEQYAYIKVDVANLWPTVTMAKDRRDDGARYYGPFRSSRRARDAVQLINDTLPIRTCKRSFKDKRSLGSPCIELSLKRCCGPCVGVADSEEYRGHINLVLKFLDGDEDVLLPLLHARLEGTVASLDFEKAAQLRDQILKVTNLVLEQARINQAASFGHAILVLPGPEPPAREIMYLVHGRRWAQFTVDDSRSVSGLCVALDTSRSRAERTLEARYPDHHSIDETALLARWIQRSPAHHALIPWEHGSAVEEIVKCALQVDLSIPFGVEPILDDPDDA